MTKTEIKTFIERVDPDAKHYYTTLDGAAYTVWAETERIGLDEDDVYGEPGWLFEIVRYTRDEYDPMPQAIEDALLAETLIGFSYRVDVDPESGYIMHRFSCEA